MSHKCNFLLTHQTSANRMDRKTRAKIQRVTAMMKDPEVSVSVSIESSPLPVPEDTSMESVNEDPTRKHIQPPQLVHVCENLRLDVKELTARYDAVQAENTRLLQTYEARCTMLRQSRALNVKLQENLTTLSMDLKTLNVRYNTLLDSYTRLLGRVPSDRTVKHQEVGEEDDVCTVFTCPDSPGGFRL